jgi:pimeloyl-ACP methyl ester carboxylesterase
VRLVLVVAIVLGGVFGTAADGQAATPGRCQTGTLPHGALSLICVPASGWNGDLVVYAHGYVPFNAPIAFHGLTLPDGAYLPDVVQSRGYAFATTSFRQNGLAVIEGAEDMIELVQRFRSTVRPAPRHTYATGASAGGLIVALLAERHPELFTGALSACGPIGDFRKQIDYVGDFRVLFDYFFPGVLPGSAISIPSSVIESWPSYEASIASQLVAHPFSAAQLVSTSKAAIDPADPSSVARTTRGVLWYNVFATNDAVAKLGGNPFDNRSRWYWGSANDALLNSRVQRFAASSLALQHLAAYRTSGTLTIPMVTLHTTGDEIVPYRQELLYLAKVDASGHGSLTPIPIFRYGHCNFTSTEVLSAFALLVWRSTGELVPGVRRYDAARAGRDLRRTQHGLAPQR